MWHTGIKVLEDDEPTNRNLWTVWLDGVKQGTADYSMWETGAVEIHLTGVTHIPSTVQFQFAGGDAAIASAGGVLQAQIVGAFAYRHIG